MSKGSRSKREEWSSRINFFYENEFNPTLEVLNRATKYTSYGKSKNSSYYNSREHIDRYLMTWP